LRLFAELQAVSLASQNLRREARQNLTRKPFELLLALTFTQS
jgi:hypothetical protein